MSFRTIIGEVRDRFLWLVEKTNVWLGFVIAPVVHTLMQYSRTPMTRNLCSSVAPIIMAFNAVPPLVAMYHRLVDPDCESNADNDEVLLWTITAMIAAIFMRSNFRKFNQSALSYMGTYYNQAGRLSSPIQYLDCCCNLLATVITTFANSASLGNSIFSNMCVNQEEERIAREVTGAVLGCAIMMQLYLLLRYFEMSRSRGPIWDAVAAGTYSIPNTAQYMLPLISDVIQLSPLERLSVAILYALACLGTTLQYCGNLQKDAQYQRNNALLVDAEEAQPLVTNNSVTDDANRYFFQKGLQGNALKLLVMGISVCVKTMAGWLALKRILDRYLPGVAITILNSVFVGYMFGAVQLSRALEVA